MSGLLPGSNPRQDAGQPLIKRRGGSVSIFRGGGGGAKPPLSLPFSKRLAFLSVLAGERRSNSHRTQFAFSRIN